eukprot:4243211-Prymnesium_polylepis.2
MDRAQFQTAAHGPGRGGAAGRRTRSDRNARENRRALSARSPRSDFCGLRCAQGWAWSTQRASSTRTALRRIDDDLVVAGTTVADSRLLREHAAQVVWSMRAPGAVAASMFGYAPGQPTAKAAAGYAPRAEARRIAHPVLLRARILREAAQNAGRRRREDEAGQNVRVEAWWRQGC